MSEHDPRYMSRKTMEEQEPEGACGRSQLEALVSVISIIRTNPMLNQAPLEVTARTLRVKFQQMGVIDVSTYPIAQEHLLLCMAALETAQRHAQLAAYYVSRGE